MDRLSLTILSFSRRATVLSGTYKIKLVEALGNHGTRWLFVLYCRSLMKKRILLYFLCLLLALPSSVKSEESLRRGLFVTLIQDPVVLSSREEIARLIDFSKKARIQILFVQIYRANKAWFPSKIGDTENYEAASRNLSEDPFGLLIKQAHQSGIEVHAWLNMLSLSANEKAPLLQKYGTDILTRNLKKKKTLADYKIDNQYFLEPSDPRVREELSNMVAEILRAYPDLDGIQFDYIRYPDRFPSYGYSKMNVERFKKATGLKKIEEKSEIWKNWKRKQVTEFLELLVKKARSIRPKIQISTTGCMSYVRAYQEAFQDWPSWVNQGLIDFVTIMSYAPKFPKFQEEILDAKKRIADLRKLNIGIGAYALTHSPETFSDEFRLCEKAGGGACVVFHYGSLLENPALADSLIQP